MDKHDRVQQSFARALGNYENHAPIQAAIAERLMELFQTATDKKHFDHILEFGCGTGLLTQYLAGLSPRSLTLNDLVPSSEKAIASCLNNKTPPWEFLSGPIETIPLKGPFDLIASTSTIQWIDDIDHLLNRLHCLLKPGGWLILSGFGSNHFQELNTIVSHPKKLSYRDEEAWNKSLGDLMSVQTISRETNVLHFPKALDILKHLRNTGVNASAGTTWSKRQLQDFIDTYENNFKDENGVRLTYEPVYIIAQKSP